MGSPGQWDHDRLHGLAVPIFNCKCVNSSCKHKVSLTSQLVPSCGLAHSDEQRIDWKARQLSPEWAKKPPLAVDRCRHSQVHSGHVFEGGGRLAQHLSKSQKAQVTTQSAVQGAEGFIAESKADESPNYRPRGLILSRHGHAESRSCALESQDDRPGQLT